MTFLLMGTVFGLLFVFLVPPTQAADETTHFYRAYELSEGHLFAKTEDVHGYGDELPKQVYTVSRQLFADIPSHYERKFNYHQIPPLLSQKMKSSDGRMVVHIEGAAVYSPAGYLPQIVAIRVVRAIWPSVTLMYYAGRLCDLAVWMIGMYVAIRLWPGNKWAIFALAMTPMCLSQGATFSPDATINALSFVIISGAFYLSRRAQALTKGQVTVMFVLLTWLSLCKPIFFVFGLLALLATRRSLPRLRQRLLLTAGLLLVALGVTALWSVRVSKYSLGMDYYYYPHVPIDAARQAHFILAHPLSYLHALGAMYFTSAGNLMVTTFIGRLGWWDVDMPLWLVFGTYALIGLAMVARQAGERLGGFSRRERAVAGLTFAAGFMALNAVLYITITAVGAPYITGLQGRYLIAFSPLLIPVFAGLLEVRNWNRLAARLYPVAYAVILATSLLVTVNRFR